MSNTPVQEPPAQARSLGSGQTLPPQPFQPTSDPLASKRVCFYKSGDYKFSGHRLVINARTFKTFDALLDALSKKVPLPFGVRTITTPRGIHMVKALDDLHDGASYVCSDRKRVKPLNLEEVNRRQVPWNTTRPFSAGRRRHHGLQYGATNQVTNRPAKVTDRVAVRTPKRLVVIKNKDPTLKRTIVLQRRTAPTFDALLDYLSQILQFPVLKLFSTDGRRVDGLAGLILCSGVVVAAGNEPFRLGNYSSHRMGQMAQVMYVDTVEPSMLHARAQNNKSLSSGRGSRNFSLSSERHIVNQIIQSRNGSRDGHLHHHNGPFERGVNHRHTSIETSATGRVDNDHDACIVPQDDDIEKSFCVNQDGSMTVEMKVHLTIKEEELLHWTTTLSRSSLSKRTACASISESGNSSPDSNNAFAKESSSISEDERKEENHPARAGKGVGFNNERVYEGYASSALKKAKAKTGLKRTPTPGPRHAKKASIESVKMVTESEVRESTLGHYSYMERMTDGDTAEEYCIVRHSSSSSRPVPKPRKTASAGATNKGSHSSIRSSGVAEVLQIQNNGMEVTETVMHIYESQGCYDNYFANEEYSADSVPMNDSTPAAESKPSTDSGSRSSSNDCDIDSSWQPPTTDSLQRQKEEMLSLSSDPITSTHDIINNLSSVTENEPQTATNSQVQERVRKDKTPKSEKKKKMVQPARNKKSSTSTSSSDRKQKESTVSPSKNSKRSSIEKISSNTSVGKKNLSSSESAKSGVMSRGAQKPHIKKVDKDEKSGKEQALLVNTENVRKTPAKTQNMTKAAAKDNGHNVNSPSGRPQMKKNMLGILQPKKSLLPGKKPNKPKSVTEITESSPKRSSDLNESFSMPSLNPSPSDIHQYVENWLEKASPQSDPVPYTEDVTTVESEPRAKVVFKIGADSESDEKTEAQTNLDEYYASPSDAVKKSSSCLSIPLSHEQRAISLAQNEQYMRGLCVSMPTVRVDPVQQQNTLRSHKSAEAIGPAINEPSLSTSNILSPKEKITPVVRHLCSSVQCIRGVSDTNTASNLEKSNSLPDFPTQVASVFGSSCKAFLSFLSVMTLRDTITSPALEDGSQSGSPSEAMLMIESLQKISVVDDEEEQRASLTDLRSRASSQFRERWKDFQILRERLESEPLSPRVSETEFALDVVSEGGDVFEDQHLVIDELMEELNMPQDLRAEISSTIQQARSFYPVEESTFVETERNQSDSEEDVEKFVEQCSNETKQSPEPNSCSIAEDITQTEQDDDNVEIDSLKKTQTVYADQTKMMTESENEMEQEAVEEDREDVNDREDGDTKEVEDDDGEETEKADSEREEEAEEGALTEERMDQEECEVEKGSRDEERSVVKVEEGTEGEVTVDEEEEGDELEEGDKDLVKETEEGSMDEEVQEAREHQSVEDTDEREGVEETEEDGEGEGEVDVEEDEEEEEEGEEEEGETEEKQREEIKEVADQVEVDEGEEEENTEEREQEEAEEADALTEDEEEEAEVGFKVTEENTEEEDMNKTVEKTDERGEVESLMDEMEEEEEVEEEEEEEEEEKDVEKDVTEDDEEEMEDVIEKDDEEEKVKNAIAEMEEEAEEEEEEQEEEEEKTDAAAEKDVEKEVIEDEEEELEEVTEERNEGDEEDEEEAKTAVSREENSEEEDQGEEEEKEQEEVEEGEDAEVKSMEGKVMTDEEEEGEETDKNVEEEEEEEEGDGGEESGKEEEKTGNSLEEDSLEEGVAVEEREEEEENESDGLNEEVDQVEEPQAEAEEESASGDADSVADGADCKNLLAEALYLQQQSSCEEEANAERKAAEHDTESPTKYSSEGQCVDDKGDGTDTVNELETDKEGEQHEEGRGSLPHPVEISQELLDFVNSALQSSSLIFIYDAQGNVRIEPDNARVIQTKQIVIPKSRQDSSYGLKQLPSPSTSDLSDYRPETSESGGYKTQDSVDIVTESGEEASSPVCRHQTDGIANAEPADSKSSVGSDSEVLQSSRAKSEGSKSSSGTKASKEDLSYFSAGSSQKLESEAPAETKRCVSQDLTDGVLIDQGRWLLKENHLIRKSPPISVGMYDNVDTTSIDTGQENNSDDDKTQHNPLAAISSSELEEMAKPQTPKCTYYNMPHGSDSDPFLDDASVKSGKREASGAKGRGVRVSPMIDTSKTWANKNGSMSSFASVEFKVPDRKVHPEGESSAVAQPRRTSSGAGRALQAQDSLDALHVRCGQYCPIL